MADEKTMPPSRALVLNTLLSILASCAVFAIMAWLVLVPQMARQENEIRELRANVVAMQSALDEVMNEPEEQPAPAAAAAPSAAAPGAPAAGGVPSGATPGAQPAAATPAPAAPAAAAPAQATKGK